VRNENSRKNQFEGAIERDVPDAARANYIYKWSFDANRNLVVDIAGLPPQAANAIRGLATRPEFKGRVIVNG